MSVFAKLGFALVQIVLRELSWVAIVVKYETNHDIVFVFIPEYYRYVNGDTIFFPGAWCFCG